MVLIDSSIWIRVLSKNTPEHFTHRLKQGVEGRDVVLTRFQQLELLQGCRDERQWVKLSRFLDGQDYLEMLPDTWQSAARIFYELRKQGVTVRSPIDCCIAQVAMDNRVLLIHDDRDFEAIGGHFPLQHQRFSL